jgi:hypothetical protein
LAVRYNDTILIEAELTLVGPFSAAQPDGDARYNNFPLIQRGVDADGRPAMTGYIPAGAIRGKLRRGAVMPALLMNAEAGTPWPLATVYERLIGQNAASEAKMEDEETLDLAAIAKQRDADPVLDLFGSGLGLKSRLLVSHFMPNENTLPAVMSGVRTDLDATEGVLESLGKKDQAAFVQREANNRLRSQAEAAAEQLERMLKMRGQDRPAGRARQSDWQKAQALSPEQATAAEAQLEELRKRAITAREAMGGMEVSSLLPHTHLALPPGLVLKGRLIVDRPRDRDVQLLTDALDMLSRRPLLGAHVARGCGEISATFDFKRNGDLFRRVVVSGFAPAKVVDLAPAAVAAVAG